MLNTGKQAIFDVSVGAVDTMDVNKQNVFDSENARHYQMCQSLLMLVNKMF